MTDDDLPHDAWLREALRHAPDAEAGPPPKLNQTILRMGRAAVAPRPERRPSPAVPMAAPSSSGGLGDAIAALWAWLARPPVAAGFAGLMVATVAGVMWWDRPLEEALPPREEAVAAAPPVTVAEPAPASTTPPGGLPEAAKRAAVPTGTDATAARSKAAPTAPAAPTIVAKAEAPPPPVVAVAPTPATAPAPTPTPAAAAESVARERESTERRMAAAPPPATAAADAAAPGALSGRAAAMAAPAAAASTAIETPSLSNLRFEIRRQPDAWTWQRDDGEAHPMDQAMENWIAQADRTSRTSWQLGASGPDSSTTTLRFTRGGVVRAVLRLGPSGMRLTRGGKTEQAELSRGAVSALQGSLDALGP